MRASESTPVEECPEQLKDRLATDTNLTQAPTQSLTRGVRTVDYDRTSAVPACVGGVNVAAGGRCASDNGRVWESHGVTVLGLSPVLEDESLVMTCCDVCKDMLV